MPLFSSLVLPLADTGFTANTTLAPFDRRGNQFVYKESNFSAGYNLAYKALSASVSIQTWPATKQQPLHKVRIKGVQPFAIKGADGNTPTNASNSSGSFDLLFTAPAAAFQVELNMLNRLLYGLIKTYGLTTIQSLVRDQEGMV